MIPFTLSPRGELQGVSIHDARSTRLIIEETVVNLTLAPTSGSSFEVRLSGCLRFGTRRLRNVLIIDQVLVWRATEVPILEQSHEDGAWPVLFTNDVELSETKARSEALLASRGAADWLVKIECSYGGTLAALCSAIEIASID